MNLDKKEKRKIFLIIVLTPITLGVLLNIPGGKLTIGDESSWVGFFGNYAGGIIGGIVAYIIAKSQIIHEKQEREQDKEELKQENSNKLHEQEKYIKNIIDLFLLDEIISNFRIIAKEKSYLDALERRAKGENNTSYSFHPQLNFEEFDRVKFELIKYNSDDVIDAVEFYRVCKILIYEPNTASMSETEATSIISVIKKWNNKLNKKNG